MSGLVFDIPQQQPALWQPPRSHQNRRSPAWTVLIAFCSVLIIAPSMADAAPSRTRSLEERPSRAMQPVPHGAYTPHFKNTAADPVGDTFGVGATQLDLTSLTATASDDTLVVELVFAGSVSAPDSGNPDALDGFIDLDTDQDGTTGDVPWTDFRRTDGGQTGMGNEYYVDFFGYDAVAGTVEVIEESSETLAGVAAITFDNSIARVEIPLSMIGGSGSVDVATIIGTLSELTDLAPNQGSLSATEEPGILIQDDRFRVSVEWRDFAGNEGAGRMVSRSDDSVVYYFFTADNWEMLLKVLDGCENNGNYWVFFAAVTNVEFTITVTDTQTDQQRVFVNPLGQAADAITDTSAFATCP